VIEFTDGQLTDMICIKYQLNPFRIVALQPPAILRVPHVLDAIT
jgi:hypothetical protein